MNFSNGDRVIYVGLHPDTYDTKRIGWIGTVEGILSRGNVDVRFDGHVSPRPDGLYGVFPQNIAPYNDAVDETEAYFV